MRVHMAAVLAMLLMACSSEESGGTGAGGGSSEGLVLATSAITLAPGEERYLCWSVAVPEGDGYPLGALDFHLPAGVHHYQVEVQADPPAEQPWECGMGEGGPPGGGGPGEGGGPGGPPPGGFMGPVILAVGGPGTAPTMEFPAGTAAMLQPGSHVTIQLHLMNVSGEPREFAPGEVHLERADESGALAQIGVLLVNDDGIDIPPNTTDIEAGFDCVAPAAIENVFQLWPHMHMLGDRISITVDGAPVVDVDWSFEDQKLYPTDLSVAQGGTIGVRCLFDNPTDAHVTFGMSTKDEMCTAFVYYYPAIDGLSICEGE